MKPNEMTLPELLSAALKHKDMPNELKTDLWNFLNDRNKNDIDPDGVEQMSLMLGIPLTVQSRAETGAAYPTDESGTEKMRFVERDIETENIALQISGLLKNPHLPASLYNSLKRGLCDEFNNLPAELNDELCKYEESPEYIAKLIQFSRVKH